MRNWIIATALLGILLFGCVGSGTQTTGPQAAASTPTSGDAGVGEVSNQFAGKTFEELAKLGVPVECDVSYKIPVAEVENTKTKMYVKGSQLRVDTQMMSGGQNLGATIIMRGDGFAYSQFEDKSLLNSMTGGKMMCDWIKVDVDTGSVGSIGDYKDEDKVNLDCKPSMFGDEMFAVSGKACTMDDIQRAMME